MKQKIEQILAAYGLKKLPRAGWIQSGIDPLAVESVASHSWGMAFLFTIIEPLLAPNIDRYRGLRMAVMHDLAESRVGDMTPQDGVDFNQKHDLERQAYEELMRDHPNGDDLLAIWEEFEAGQSPEAQIIKQLDKLDMLLQAYLYEKHENVVLDSFWENTESLFKESAIASIYDYIRMNRHKSKGNME